ncbi:hypothetical protein AJ79_05494 [Helicocarpus griseus UAMH5409]|uniref:Thiolase-like protein type 1 additional C-terminal domain-containing protein n=1 Tax=Helicocarpus griseus UAMH5409 TaxID=1447875 RepID=A0A2B7XMP4_9EURO|nr:hypothetical protein AJ79_05494 [Helicocarpus griseus UAMH5409]
MSGSFEIPVVVGVGDIKNPSSRPEDAIEPLGLMLQATKAAIDDTTLQSASAGKLQAAIDSISVVANWTWPYPNTPELLAGRLGCNARHMYESEHGGNAPAELLDEAARRIAYGKSQVAVVAGGEALASLAGCKQARKFPKGWTHLENATSILERPRPKGLGTTHGLSQPTQIYAMYENSFRADQGEQPSKNHEDSSKLYAEFAQIAAANPNAWRHGMPADTAEKIGTVTKKNRMICSPYPLLMNAFNIVNMSAACILTSASFARELGIPESKWIYPIGGAGTRDCAEFWKRPDFYSSRSLSLSLDKALTASALTGDDIDLFDFYSCFPIIPKLACHHLKLPLTGGQRPITLLGGLTSFGGAGNNYSLHAITEMVRQLRLGKGQYGLVLANGGVVSYHHTVCLSRNPRKDGSPYPSQNPLPRNLRDDHPPIDERAQGRAVVETYTVQYGRDGSPQIAFIVGRLQDSGHRFIANAADGATLRELSSTVNEQIGKHGWVDCEKESGRNVFSLQEHRI